MPTISAHVVAKPRRDWGCALCRKPPSRDPVLVLFGAACEGDKPYRMRICLACGGGTSDPVTRRALLEHGRAAAAGKETPTNG